MRNAKPLNPPLLSLREAARRLGRNNNYIRGVADTLGIVLSPAGTALMMTWADFKRIEKAVEKSEKFQVASA